ncbi:hypothetical protein BV898_02579 [Hypsibius exemplaris]|uniref:LysM domain-containing protein n=1 Tax=Hypsibius exemplaris TaxID=2072580 RepID=A0A1W0X7S4_HYPEX|nr:hypothetical protein BV898_02579 [Hypsibius exemplaris]
MSSIKHNPLDVEATESDDTQRLNISAAFPPPKNRFLSRAFTIIFSIPAVVALLLLLGALFVFYPREEAAASLHRLSHAATKKDAESAIPVNHDILAPAPVPAPAPAPVPVSAAGATPAPQVIDPFDGPSCFAGVNEGDHCEGFVGAYGITSIERLVQMNPGLQCNAGGMMTVGHSIYIRKGQGCGTECTKELC